MRVAMLQGRPTSAKRGAGTRVWAAGAEPWLLAGADLVTAAAALGVTGAVRRTPAGWIVQALVVLLALLALFAASAYERTRWLREHPLWLLRRLLLAATVAAWAAVILAAAFELRVHLGALIGAWAIMALGWFAVRRAAVLVRRSRAPERVLILGAGAVAREVAELLRRPGSSSVVVGCLADDEEPGAVEGEPASPILGSIEQLPAFLDEGGIDRVVVAFSSRSTTRRSMCFAAVRPIGERST